MVDTVASYLAALKGCVEEAAKQDIAGIADVICQAARAGRNVFLCGNGGSASTAQHFACDLAKAGVRAQSLCDNAALLSALANDIGYEAMFAAQLEGRLHPGDVLIGISVSGNSPNVLAAIRSARQQHARTIGLTGFGGGQLAALADRTVVISSRDYGPVEDAHLAVAHMIARLVGQGMQRGMEP